MKILFLSNHFITLYSFRKELIKKLAADGNEVYLSLPECEDNKYFVELGCKIVPTEIDRRGVNPLKDLKLIGFYKKMFARTEPDIIFSYTIKPNIYGTIASGKRYRQVCNITGTGATFLKNNFVSKICKFLYRISVKKCYKVFFQNSGDCDFFVKNRMIGDNYDMLPGSGCNLDEHKYIEMPSSENLKFIFIGRVMQLKGIDEYLECAKAIKSEYPSVTFYIAGWNEEEKYKSIISDYEKHGDVEYIGFRKDIDEWIAKCHCTVLPSHGGEGVPNVLLESAATGRICIASNISGSQDVVEDGKTGFLFEPKNSEKLIECVKKVISMTDDQRRQMGLAGRRKVEREFNRQIVIDAYINELKAVGGYGQVQENNQKQEAEI